MPFAAMRCVVIGTVFESLAEISADERCELRRFSAGAALGKALNEAALWARFVVGLARAALRAGPAIVHEIKNHAVDVVKFDLIGGVVAVVGLAHDPMPARL